MTQPETPPLPSGHVLQSASNLVITGGTFIGSQTSVTTANEPSKSLKSIYAKAAPNAILNAGGRADEVKCFPGTREEVLAKVEAWINTEEANRDRRIFWLSGPAGAGKSAIVQTVAERCVVRGVPMVNFFFFRADFTRNHASPLVATLLCQLLDTYPMLRPLVDAVLADKPLIVSQALSSQFTHLIQIPVCALREASVDQRPIVVLIDGLDECDSAGKHEQKVLLRSLHGLISSENSPFIVLVASRPEPHLTMTFNEIGSCEGSIFLDEGYRPSDDIRLFVVAEFARIKFTHHLGHILDKNWPSEDSINAVVVKSSGQFIYAATILRFIANSSASPALSLDKVLGLRPVKKSSPFAELDAIYSYILSQVEDWDVAKDILTAQILSASLDWRTYYVTESGPIPPSRRLPLILRPMGYEVDELPSYTSDLTAIVRVDLTDNQLEFYHASLSDFLFDDTRSLEYHINISVFIAKFVPAHFEGIRDFDSLVASFLVIARINQPIPSIDKALVSPPPRIEWAHTSTNKKTFVVWFLRDVEKLYFHDRKQLYRRILRNWLVWCRDVNLIMEDKDLETVKFGSEIWHDITSPQDDFVKIQTPSARLRPKRVPFWKKIFRAT